MENLDDIYRRHAETVYKFLLSLCRDAHTAEELTQETFYQAVRSIHRFDGSCQVSTWLCQIAKHALYKEQKRRKRLVPQEERENTVPEEHFFEAVHSREQALALHRQLHTLPEPYREVFMLRVFGELSFHEIADICGKSESWAKVTFYRAKNKLLEKWEGQP